MIMLWLSSYILRKREPYTPDLWWFFPTTLTAFIIGLLEAAFELNFLLWVILK